MITVKTYSRPCDGCTKCCQGYLEGSAYGVKFHHGKPCAFLGGGCTIYPSRPPVCRNFECEWKQNPAIPEWLKPDKYDVVIVSRKILDYNYLLITSAGKPVLSRVHEWAKEYSQLDPNNHVVVHEEISKAYSQDKAFGYIVGVETFGV